MVGGAARLTALLATLCLVACGDENVGKKPPVAEVELNTTANPCGADSDHSNATSHYTNIPEDGYRGERPNDGAGLKTSKCEIGGEGDQTECHLKPSLPQLPGGISFDKVKNAKLCFYAYRDGKEARVPPNMALHEIVEPWQSGSLAPEYPNKYIGLWWKRSRKPHRPQTEDAYYLDAPEIEYTKSAIFCVDLTKMLKDGRLEYGIALKPEEHQLHWVNLATCTAAAEEQRPIWEIVYFGPASANQ